MFWWMHWLKTFACTTCRGTVIHEAGFKLSKQSHPWRACHVETRPASNFKTAKNLSFGSLFKCFSSHYQRYILQPKRLCPALRSEATALSLYEVIKNSNDTGEISFYWGDEGWSEEGGVTRQKRRNKVVGGKRKEVKRSKTQKRVKI